MPFTTVQQKVRDLLAGRHLPARGSPAAIEALRKIRRYWRERHMS